MLDSYTLSVLLSVNTSGSFSSILGEEQNIQKDPTDFGPTETEVKVRAGSSAFHCDCWGQQWTPCRKKVHLWSQLKYYTTKTQLMSARRAAKDDFGSVLSGSHLYLLLMHSAARVLGLASVRDDTLWASHTERSEIAISNSHLPAISRWCLYNPTLWMQQFAMAGRLFTIRSLSFTPAAGDSQPEMQKLQQN